MHSPIEATRVIGLPLHLVSRYGLGLPRADGHDVALPDFHLIHAAAYCATPARIPTLFRSLSPACLASSALSFLQAPASPRNPASPPSATGTVFGPRWT